MQGLLVRRSQLKVRWSKVREEVRGSVWLLLERGQVLIIVTKLVDVESVNILDVFHQVPGVTEVLAAGGALQDSWDIVHLLQGVILALTGEPQLTVVTLVGQQRGDRVEAQPEIQISNINHCYNHNS